MPNKKKKVQEDYLLEDNEEPDCYDLFMNMPVIEDFEEENEGE